jgi:AraC-like DNA-binding protein
MMSIDSPVFKFGEISSVDEYLKYLSTLFSEELEFKILSESPFYFSCKLAKFSDLELIKRRTSFVSFFKVKHIEDVLIFDFPIDDKSFICNGALCDNKKQICCGKGSQVCGIFPKSERLILMVSEEILKKYLKENNFLDFDMIEQNFNKYEVSAESKNKVTEILLNEFDKLERLNNQSKIESSLVLDSKDRILRVLSNYIVEHKSGKYINTKNRDRVLFRALEYISEADINDLTLSKLEENVHASVRTIEYAFKTRLGISPKKYIIIARLNHIRRELLLANANDVSINEVINKYNIANKGRFNTDYYCFFNEYPIETLNKNI